MFRIQLIITGAVMIPLGIVAVRMGIGAKGIDGKRTRAKGGALLSGLLLVPLGIGFILYGIFSNGN